MLLFEEERGPDERLKLQFEAVSKLDEKEREAVETLIAGVLYMHDAKRWTQPQPLAATPKPAAKKKVSPNVAGRGDSMLANDQNALVPVESIAQSILLIRGQKVIIDADLAALYGVPTKRLNEQVKRNLDRFPADFMVQLNLAEKVEVVANCDHLAKLKFSKSLPFAFMEHGALMAASVLNTPRAVEVSVYVVRAFVALRELLVGNKELALKLSELEARLERKLDTHDQAIAGLISAMRELMRPLENPPKRPIGFVTGEEKAKKGG